METTEAVWYIHHASIFRSATLLLHVEQVLHSKKLIVRVMHMQITILWAAHVYHIIRTRCHAFHQLNSVLSAAWTPCHHVHCKNQDAMLFAGTDVFVCLGFHTDGIQSIIQILYL